MNRRWSPVSFLVLLLSTGAASFGISACGSAAPQATGTKTDWFRSCEDVEDCGEGWEWSCLCGLCTTVCETDEDCIEGACGNAVATASACGLTGEIAERGDLICLPTGAVACEETSLPYPEDLGPAVPVVCDQPGALICEDFNDPLPEDYSTWDNGEAVAVVQECSESDDSGSLRLSSVDGGWTQLRMRLPEPITGEGLHARFFVRVEEGGTFPDQVILFELWDQEGGTIDDRITFYLNREERLGLAVGSASTAFWANDMPVVSRGQWHCLELSLDVADSGSAVVRYDREVVIDESELDTLPDEPIIVAVVENHPPEDSPGTAVELYVDDLVVATEPIGCD